MDGQVLSYRPPGDVPGTLTTSKQTAGYISPPASSCTTSCREISAEEFNSAQFVGDLRDQPAAAGDDHHVITPLFPSITSLHCEDMKSEDVTIREIRSAAEAPGTYKCGRHQQVEAAAAAAAGGGAIVDDDLYPAGLKRLSCAVISCSASQKANQLDGNEEEEGGSCVTPTAREQRIPLEPLVCPSAPKKKKAAIKYCKRKRPFYSLHELSYDQATIASHNTSATVLPPFGAFLVAAVNPPADLHTLPDQSIKALFHIST